MAGKKETRKRQGEETPERDKEESALPVLFGAILLLLL